jgi:formylglycine-generating enzyme required for sulfatase activity
MLTGIEMTFSFIPPGPFLMGSPPGEEGRYGNERLHRVALARGFWLGACPVTQAQWGAVLGGNPSGFKGDALPVESVSWDDCQQFCQRLGERTGKRFRLPTEAEWEYACRAGTTTPFHFGETLSTGQANYDGNYTYGKGQKGVYRERTTQPGSVPPNAWGLFDMHGNVFEWCSGRYGGCRSAGVGGPPAGGGTRRVMRGGSWFDRPERCRSAYRYAVEPGRHDDGVGCRVVLCGE